MGKTLYQLVHRVRLCTLWSDTSTDILKYRVSSLRYCVLEAESLNGGSFSSLQAVDSHLAQVSTPLKVDAWESSLINHPDRDGFYLPTDLIVRW